MNPTPTPTPKAGGCVPWIAGAILVACYAIWHPAPTPVPPDPTPTPQPVPVDPAGSFLVAVTDNENRTPDQAAVLLDEDLGKWLVEKKIGWRIIDKGSKAYTDAEYDKVLAADGVAPPAVVLWGPKSISHRAIVAPNTTEALKQWVMGSPHTGPPFIEVNGEKRYLTRLPPEQAKFQAPRGGEFTDAHSVIPRSQWREINNRSKFPPEQWIYDQDGLGACVGNGSTAALRKIRFLSGMTDVRLAPGCTYAQINGGRDQGAVISDSLTALQQTGTISSAKLGSDQKPCYLKQLPSDWKKEAARFRIEEAYHCASFDEVCSAIQLGYIVPFGFQVGNNFGQFTPDGVAGASNGPGNHCVHADGLHKLPSGEWALDTVNSWGADWGPWHNGRCYLVERHFQGGDQPDAFAVKTAVEDPARAKQAAEEEALLAGWTGRAARRRRRGAERCSRR